MKQQPDVNKLTGIGAAGLARIARVEMLMTAVKTR